jgi:hypothetical protein
VPKPYLRTDYDPSDGLVYGFIEFAGRAININRLAAQEELDYSYLWRVFNGYRMPSLAYATVLAQHLQMSRAELIAELDRRRQPTAIQD